MWSFQNGITHSEHEFFRNSFSIGSVKFKKISKQILMLKSADQRQQIITGKILTDKRASFLICVLRNVTESIGLGSATLSWDLIPISKWRLNNVLVLLTHFLHIFSCPLTLKYKCFYYCTWQSCYNQVKLSILSHHFFCIVFLFCPQQAQRLRCCQTCILAWFSVRRGKTSNINCKTSF